MRADCRREAVVEPEVPGIRIAGSDFLRVGRGTASEGMSGGETREGVEGAFSIRERWSGHAVTLEFCSMSIERSRNDSSREDTFCQEGNLC